MPDFRVTWTVERSGSGQYTRYPVHWFADGYEVESNFSMGKSREEAEARAAEYAKTKLTQERIRQLLVEDMDARFTQIEEMEERIAEKRAQLHKLAVRLTLA